MGFWKEMGVKALEKGKGLFRGGKQATEAAKHTEEIVKGAKVSMQSKSKFNAIPKSKETLAASREAVEQVAMKEKNVGKAAGKTSKASKEMAADEAKETVKESTQQAKEATQKAVKGNSTLKNAAMFYTKNPKVLGWHAALGLGGYSLISGEGVIAPLLYLIGGKKAQENGLGGMVGQVAAGEKAPKIYETVANAAGSVIDEGVGFYQFSKNSLGNAMGEMTNPYQMGNGYVGNGMVNNGNGQYYDPTTQQVPNLYQASNPDMQSQEGMVEHMMGGMNNLVNQVSGGTVSKMNILALALSSYMMFGRFGWLSKAASLLLGGMTLKNINNRQLSPLQQRQSNVQQGNQYRNPSAVSPSQETPMFKSLENPIESEEDNITYRSRRM